MASSTAELKASWSDLVNKHQIDLDHASPLAPNNFSPLTYDALKSSIEDLRSKFCQRNILRGFEAIDKTLVLVESFSVALSLVSQNETSGMMILGSLKLVMEVR